MVAVKRGSRISQHARVLEHLIRENGWRIGAELGVLEGRTFMHLTGRFPDLTLVGVDIWRSRPEQNALNDRGGRSYDAYDMDDLYRKVRAYAADDPFHRIVIRLPTAEAVHLFDDGTFDFVFIDADHTVEGVSADILAWGPKVKQSGWMIGDDYNRRLFPGVVQAVREMLPRARVYPVGVWAVPIAETVFAC